MFDDRIKIIRQRLSEFKLDAFLVTFMPHVRYVSGFSGSSGICLISQKSKFLITDHRYEEQVLHETTGWKILFSKNNLFDEILRKNLFKNLNTVGIDGNQITYAQFKNLVKSFPKNRLLPKAGFIDEISAIKNRYEVEQISKAAKITDRVFKKILENIKPGISELDIAAEITYLHRIYGASGDAFEPIVVSGLRGSMPHAGSSQKKIRKGELLTIDLGCVVNGYHCDMTRTIAIGKPKSEAVKIYNLVLTAQQKAIDAAKEGISLKELDIVARTYLTNKGYANYFNHSLGHGIGLQIHEPPRISSFSIGKLISGNVVTIEPGIYIFNFGGVRIEDNILINKNSNRVLNSSTKDLIVL